MITLKTLFERASQLEKLKILEEVHGPIGGLLISEESLGLEIIIALNHGDLKPLERILNSDSSLRVHDEALLGWANGCGPLISLSTLGSSASANLMEIPQISSNEAITLYELEQARVELGRKRIKLFPIVSTHNEPNFTNDTFSYLIPYLSKFIGYWFLSEKGRSGSVKLDRLLGALNQAIQHAVPNERFFASVELAPEKQWMYMRAVILIIQTHLERFFEDTQQVALLMSLYYSLQAHAELIHACDFPMKKELVALCKVTFEGLKTFMEVLVYSPYLDNALFDMNDRIKKLLLHYDTLDQSTQTTSLHCQLLLAEEPQWILMPVDFGDGVLRPAQIILPSGIKKVFIQTLKGIDAPTEFLPFWGVPTPKQLMEQVVCHKRVVSLLHRQTALLNSVHEVSHPGAWSLQAHDSLHHWMRLSIRGPKVRNDLILMAQMIRQVTRYSLSRLGWDLFDMDIPIADRGDLSRYKNAIMKRAILSQRLSDEVNPFSVLMYIFAAAFMIAKKEPTYVKANQTFYDLVAPWYVDRIPLPQRTWVNPYELNQFSFDFCETDANWFVFSAYVRLKTTWSQATKDWMLSHRDALIPHFKWYRNSGLYLEFEGQRLYPLSSAHFDEIDATQFITLFSRICSKDIVPMHRVRQRFFPQVEIANEAAIKPVNKG